MVKTRFFLVAAALLALLVWSDAALAQIVYGQKSSGDVSVTYTHWKLKTSGGEATISQWATPLSGFVPLADNFDAQVYIGTASNSLSSGGQDFSLNGLEDVRLQVNHSFSNDHLVASLGMNLPTGKKELNLTEEWQILQVLSRDYVNFPVRRLGEGFGVNGLLGAATMLGQFRTGIGVGYSILGGYTPYEGVKDYNPGDVLTANVGFDTQRGNNRWGLQVLETVYGTDKYSSKKAFKQGEVTQFILSGDHATEKMSFGGQVGYVLRGRNQRYAYPAETLVDQLKLFGNEFDAGLNCGFAAGTNFTVSPFVSGRFIQANEETLGKSHIYGFGSGVTRKFAKGQVDASLGWYTGKADGDKIDLIGIQVSAGFRLTM